MFARRRPRGGAQAPVGNWKIPPQAIAPVVRPVAIAYFAVRRGAADSSWVPGAWRRRPVRTLDERMLARGAPAREGSGKGPRGRRRGRRGQDRLRDRRLLRGDISALHRQGLRPCGGVEVGSGCFPAAGENPVAAGHDSAGPEKKSSPCNALIRRENLRSAPTK